MEQVYRGIMIPQFQQEGTLSDTVQVERTQPLHPRQEAALLQNTFPGVPWHSAPPSQSE